MHPSSRALGPLGGRTVWPLQVCGAGSLRLCPVPPPGRSFRPGVRRRGGTAMGWRALPLLLLALAAAALPKCRSEEYKREISEEELQEIKRYRKALEHPPPYEPDTSTVVRLSWQPRAFLFPNFLSDAECDFIVNFSRPAMLRSTVGNARGFDSIRTSYGTFLDKYSHAVLKRIEERVGAWTFLPLENQEAMQVLRYQDGQKYGSHYDSYSDERTKASGPRYATVLMYLSDVEKGGETVFPNSEPDKTFKDDTWSDCAKQGVAVKARKGNAIVFFSISPDGKFDPHALHSGCPVIKGEKWSATKWIHTSGFDPPYRDPSICQDDDPACPGWAAAGECERNPKFMKGTGFETQSELGFCRKSCNACQ